MMGGGEFRRSRRSVLRAVSCAVGTAIAMDFNMEVVRAQSDEKMTKARAQYQDTPNGIYSCATCTLFVPPAACKVVSGEVSPDGWCRVFALAD